MRRVAGLVLTLLVGGLAWAQGKPTALPPGSAPVVAPMPAPPTSAVVAVATENGMAQDGRIRVQFAAQQQTILAAEINAKLISLPLREGDAFRSGQLLAQFDCAVPRAQLNKAEATAEAARQTLKVNRRLAELGSISTLEVDQATAKVAETEAEVAAMRVMLGKCSVAAPFTGRVAKVHVEPHQFVAQGKPLIEIVDSQRLEVRLLVPSKWLAWLAKGTRFSVRVDELNRDIAVAVSRIGARIDPVSQTVIVIGQVVGSPDALLPGMSGWASFAQAGAK